MPVEDDADGGPSGSPRSRCLLQRSDHGGNFATSSKSLLDGLDRTPNVKLSAISRLENPFV